MNLKWQNYGITHNQTQISPPQIVAGFLFPREIDQYLAEDWAKGTLKCHFWRLEKGFNCFFAPNDGESDTGEAGQHIFDRF